MQEEITFSLNYGGIILITPFFVGFLNFFTVIKPDYKNKILFKNSKL